MWMRRVRVCCVVLMLDDGGYVKDDEYVWEYVNVTESAPVDIYINPTFMRDGVLPVEWFMALSASRFGDVLKPGGCIEVMDRRLKGMPSPFKYLKGKCGLSGKEVSRLTAPYWAYIDALYRFYYM